MRAANAHAAIQRFLPADMSSSTNAGRQTCARKAEPARNSELVRPAGAGSALDQRRDQPESSKLWPPPPPPPRSSAASRARGGAPARVTTQRGRFACSMYAGRCGWGFSSRRWRRPNGRRPRAAAARRTRARWAVRRRRAERFRGPLERLGTDTLGTTDLVHGNRIVDFRRAGLGLHEVPEAEMDQEGQHDSPPGKTISLDSSRTAPSDGASWRLDRPQLWLRARRFRLETTRMWLHGAGNERSCGLVAKTLASNFLVLAGSGVTTWSV